MRLTTYFGQPALSCDRLVRLCRVIINYPDGVAIVDFFLFYYIDAASQHIVVSWENPLCHGDPPFLGLLHPF
jgi:hypothetical protein